MDDDIIVEARQRVDETIEYIAGQFSDRHRGRFDALRNALAMERRISNRRMDYAADKQKHHEQLVEVKEMHIQALKQETAAWKRIAVDAGVPVEQYQKPAGEQSTERRALI